MLTWTFIIVLDS